MTTLKTKEDSKMQDKIDKTFTANHLLGDLADVVDFDGCMAVCAVNIDSPVMITKEQAMEFFGLVEVSE